MCNSFQRAVYHSNFFLLIMEYCFHFSTSALQYQIHNFADIPILNFLTSLVGMQRSNFLSSARNRREINTLSSISYLLFFQFLTAASIRIVILRAYAPCSLTFRGPCIVIYSYNKSQLDALFLRFILVKNFTCFGQILTSQADSQHK
jgi:hypothetical protein